MNFNNRKDALRKMLEEKDLSSVLVIDPKNRYYLTGFDGSSGWLLLTKESHFLITDGRYWEQVSSQCPQAELIRYIPSEHGSLCGALLATLKQREELQAPTTLGLETDGLTLASFRELTQALEKATVPYREVEGLVRELRECKDDDELACLERAAEIADQALDKALKGFGPGQKESELKAKIEYEILLLGGSSTSFPTIVASGPNGSYPHAGASSRIVQEGELITVDFGAVFEGYCSDMTRTIWYGELNGRDQDILRHTREAQKLGIEAVSPGIKASALDSLVRERLKEAKLDEFFVHSLGHGVGLEIHESPGIRSTSQEVLKLGHVITIEPGVYLPGEVGCRVEDTVVVRAGVCRVLNQFPKQALGSLRPG